MKTKANSLLRDLESSTTLSSSSLTTRLAHAFPGQNNIACLLFNTSYQLSQPLCVPKYPYLLRDFPELNKGVILTSALHREPCFSHRVLFLDSRHRLHLHRIPYPSHSTTSLCLSSPLDHGYKECSRDTGGLIRRSILYSSEVEALHRSIFTTLSC